MQSRGRRKEAVKPKVNALFTPWPPRRIKQNKEDGGGDPKRNFSSVLHRPLLSVLISAMLRRSRIQAAVFCSLIFSELVMVNAQVMESSSPYSCCGKQPAIEFRRECENTWDIRDKIIAHSVGSLEDCISPCKKIEGGVMTLDGCVDVNVTVVCRNEVNVAVEKRIYYYSQPCSGSQSVKMAAGIQGFAGLSLLAALIGGLLVM